MYRNQGDLGLKMTLKSMYTKFKCNIKWIDSHAYFLGQ